MTQIAWDDAPAASTASSAPPAIKWDDAPAAPSATPSIKWDDTPAAPSPAPSTTPQMAPPTPPAAPQAAPISLKTTENGLLTGHPRFPGYFSRGQNGYRMVADAEGKRPLVDTTIPAQDFESANPPTTAGPTASGELKPYAGTVHPQGFIEAQNNAFKNAIGKGTADIIKGVGGNFAGSNQAADSAFPVDTTRNTTVARAVGGAIPLVGASVINPLAGAAVGAAQGVGSARSDAEGTNQTAGQTAAIAAERGIFNGILGLIPGGRAVGGLVGGAKAALNAYGVNVAQHVFEEHLKGDLGIKNESDFEALKNSAISGDNAAQSLLLGGIHSAVEHFRGQDRQKIQPPPLPPAVKALEAAKSGVPAVKLNPQNQQQNTSPEIHQKVGELAQRYPSLNGQELHELAREFIKPTEDTNEQGVRSPHEERKLAGDQNAAKPVPALEKGVGQVVEGKGAPSGNQPGNVGGTVKETLNGNAAPAPAADTSAAKPATPAPTEAPGKAQVGSGVARVPGGDTAQRVAEAKTGETPTGGNGLAGGQVDQENVTNFKTALGSTYAVDERGNTTRTKQSPGRGQGEVHDQSPAVFISPKGNEAIMEEARGMGRVILASQKPDGSFEQVRPKQGDDIRSIPNLHVLVTERGTGNIVAGAKATTEPEVGKHPFEIHYKNDDKVYHMGNAITEVSRNTKEASPPTQNVGTSEQAPTNRTAQAAAVGPTTVNRGKGYEHSPLFNEFTKDVPQNYGDHEFNQAADGTTLRRSGNNSDWLVTKGTDDVGRPMVAAIEKVAREASPSPEAQARKDTTPPAQGEAVNEEKTSIAQPKPATITPEGAANVGTGRTEAQDSVRGLPPQGGGRGGEQAAPEGIVRPNDEGSVRRSPAADRRAASIEGIKRGIAPFKGVSLHDDGTNLHLQMPDGKKVRYNLVDRIAPVAHDIIDFLKSAIAANKGRWFTERGSEYAIPQDQEGWNKLPDSEKRVILDTFRTHGQYSRADDSITTTHQVAHDHSIAGEEVFHALSRRLKDADRDTYNRMMTKYDSEDAAFHDFQTSKSRAEYFKRIREGTAHESPSARAGDKYLSPKQKAEATLLSAAQDAGVLMSEHEFESFVNDRGGLHPDVLDDYKLRDANGKPRLNGDGEQVYTKEGNILKNFVNERAHSDIAKDMSPAESDRYQQRIVNELLMTKADKVRMAAEHFQSNPYAHPELKEAAEKILGKQETPAEDNEPAPFATRRKDDESDKIDRVSPREGAGRTSPPNESSSATGGIVYHGAGSDIDFSRGRAPNKYSVSDPTAKLGTWFSESRSAANTFAFKGLLQQKRNGGAITESPRTYHATLDLKNPKTYPDIKSLRGAISEAGGPSKLKASLQRAGHDGITLQQSPDAFQPGIKDHVVFDPRAINIHRVSYLREENGKVISHDEERTPDASGAGPSNEPSQGGDSGSDGRNSRPIPTEGRVGQLGREGGNGNSSSTETNQSNVLRAGDVNTPQPEPESFDKSAPAESGGSSRADKTTGPQQSLLGERHEGSGIGSKTGNMFGDTSKGPANAIEDTRQATPTDKDQGSLFATRRRTESEQSEIPKEQEKPEDQDTRPDPTLFGQYDKSPTSIKNAVVDEERAKRGLPPMMDALKRSYPDVAEEANREIDRDPKVQDRLIADLKEKPRPLTDKENYFLLQRRADLYNQRDDVAKRMTDAKASNDDAEVATQRIRAADVSDQLLELEKVSKEAGTENARGLAARRMMMNEDYSLAAMENRKRIANGGRQLTPAESDHIKELQAKIAETQKKFDDYVKQNENRARRVRAKDATSKIIAEASTRRDPLPAIKAKRESILAGLRQRVSSLRDSMGSGQFAVRGEGEESEPTSAHANDEGVVSDWSHVPNLHRDIQELAKTFVQEGVRDRDTLVDRVHGELKDILKGFSKDDTIDAISGYGKFKPLSKDEINVTLRDLKGQLQQEAKLRDMTEKGLAPLKTGVERRLPSDEERRLIQQVNDTKKKLGISATDPETELKGALDGVKTRLKNQISDLDYQIARGEKTVREKSPSPTDAEADALRAKRDDLKKQYDAMFTDPNMSDEDRIKVAMRAAEKSLATYEQRLKDNLPFDAKKPVAPTSPELDAVRARRDAAKDQLEHLQAVAGVDAVNARKQQLAEKQIAEVERKIREKELVAAKAPAQSTPELDALNAHRNVLQKTLDKIRADAAKKPPSQIDAEKQAARVKQLQESIAKIGQKISDRTPATPQAKAVESPEIEALKKQRSLLAQSLMKIRNEAKPRKTPEEIALKAFKTRTTNRIAELTERLAKKDYGPSAPKQRVALDHEAMTLEADKNRFQQQFQQELMRDRLNKRSTFEKVMDATAKWSRTSILSSPGIILKLANAAALRGITSPMEEAVGGVLSHVIPGVASRAPREGGFSTKAEARAITEGITTGIKQGWKVMKTGHSDLDAIFGKQGHLPHSYLDYVTDLHGALHTPTQYSEFARSLQKRTEFAIRAGLDPTEPATQLRLMNESYKDSLRSVFRQDNMVTDAFNRAMSRFGQADKTTGHATVGGKVAETAAKVALPVTRVPTNIATEVFQYATGAATGSARLAKALSTGLDKLKPEEADIIMRSLKKGSIGLAVMGLGYFGAGGVGGFYQRGEKRDKDDVAAGDVKVSGVTIPHQYSHHPLTTVLQMGATVRRVADSFARKSDEQPQGLGEGAMAAAVGAAEDVPFINETTEINKVLDPKQRDRAIGDRLRSAVVPQLVSRAAQFFDKDEQGNTVPRKPTGVFENLETGIPFLRQNVPTDDKKARELANR